MITQGAKGTVLFALVGIGLGVATWVGTAFFGTCTLTFYFGAISSGRMDQWNIFVPGLYDKRDPPARARRSMLAQKRR